jgi:hypothetical protein
MMPHAVLLATLLITPVIMITPVQASEEAPLQIPATTPAIWQAIDQHVVELAKLIQTGTLKEVHHHAFAIRDLTAALPALAKQQSPEQRKKIETQVKFVATLAQRLDANGDSNDRAGTESNLTKLKSVLESMRVLLVTPALK